MFQGGAGLALLAGVLVWAVGSWLNPAPTQTSWAASMGYWAAVHAVAALVSALAAFFTLGLKRPRRLRALFGATAGAGLGHIIGISLATFIPLFPDFLGSIAALVLAALFAAAGTLYGGLGERKKKAS